MYGRGRCTRPEWTVFLNLIFSQITVVLQIPKILLLQRSHRNLSIDLLFERTLALLLITLSLKTNNLRGFHTAPYIRRVYFIRLNVEVSYSSIFDFHALNIS